MVRPSSHRAVPIALLLALLAAPASANPLPFAPGESLRYRVSLAGFTGRGEGMLRVLLDDAGGDALVLAFDINVVLIRQHLELHSRSWLSPTQPHQLASTRYRSWERSPFHNRDVDLVLDSGAGQWSGRGGQGRLASSQPLDELSFIYFLRTLPLEQGQQQLDRHFDPARNPVSVRVSAPERVSINDREVTAIPVEMTVRDPDRFGGKATLRFHFSADAQRLPLRIELPSPGPAPLVLELISHTQFPPEVTP